MASARGKLFLLGAGVVGVTLILWYGYRKRQYLQAKEHGEQSRILLGEAPSLASAQVNVTDSYICECGKTVAEGGCPPGYNKELLGKVKKYERHIIVCCGTQPEEWSAKVTSQAGSFAAKLKKALSRHKREIKAKNEKVIVTNCDERSEDQEIFAADDQPRSDLIVFPDRIRYIGVTADDLDEFVKEQVVKGQVSRKLKSRPFAGQLVLVCCHGNRDSRCGEQGPVVFDKFCQALESRNIGEDVVMVRKSSHLGGHKYAAVVVIYPQGDWYGYVDTNTVESLVDEYLQKGQVVSGLWRGRMGLGPDASAAYAASLK